MSAISYYIGKDDNILRALGNANDTLGYGYSSSNGNKLNRNNSAIYNSFNAKIKNNKSYYHYALLKKEELVLAVSKAAKDLGSTQIKR